LIEYLSYLSVYVEIRNSREEMKLTRKYKEARKRKTKKAMAKRKKDSSFAILMVLQKHIQMRMANVMKIALLSSRLFVMACIYPTCALNKTPLARYPSISPFFSLLSSFFPLTTVEVEGRTNARPAFK